MWPQVAPEPPVIQNNSVVSQSAGIIAYPALATRMLAALRREQGRHKTYDHWLLIQRPQDADSGWVAELSMTERWGCAKYATHLRGARQICRYRMEIAIYVYPFYCTRDGA